MPAESHAITMNVSLPQPLKRYVDAKVSSGVYGSASEFIREAIREKAQREHDPRLTKAVLTRKLLEDLDSGAPITFTDSHFKGKKRSLLARASRKKSA